MEVVVAGLALVAMFCSVATLVMATRGPTQHLCPIHGHRFQPRYDRKLAAMPSRMVSSNVVATIEALKESYYVGDVCVRCGASKVRPSA